MRKGQRTYLRTENFPNLDKETDIQIQETQKVLNRINPNRTTRGHILIKMVKIKNKDRILKAAMEKQQITRNSCKAISWFLAETLKDRRERHDIFKVMKRKSLQLRILCPARLSFRLYGESKSFTDNQKFRSSAPQNKFYKNFLFVFFLGSDIFIKIKNNLAIKWHS